ncbi:type IV pilin protein [Dyella sp. ASV21]|uniref:type IV pilin protein n=1 Tax=Dyella sp. ASV21 TaxID=2795114 RepID=UPI0018EB000B|nr:type IV pilin protein [Dyella sp. ASV21]
MTQRGRGWRSLRQQGFTLIEVMIVVVIIAILASIAYPSYMAHTVKAKRVAAEGCMSQLASYMERYYTTYLRYDKTDSSSTAVANTPPLLDCQTQAQTGSSYAIGLDATQLTATGYVIQAVPQGNQLKRDGKCGTLTLDHTGSRGISNTSGQLSDCW